MNPQSAPKAIPGKKGVSGWTPADPTVKELLDHLAEELAGEYIRLVTEGAKEVDRRGIRVEATANGAS